MMRRTVTFFGGGRRNGRAIASALPPFSAGVPCVSHRSVTTTLPVPRLKTCGAGPSMMKTDLPCGLWPVTTLRIGFGIARTRFGKGSFQLDVGGGDHLAPMRGLLREERGAPAAPKLQMIASIVAIKSRVQVKSAGRSVFMRGNLTRAPGRQSDYRDRSRNPVAST